MGAAKKESLEKRLVIGLIGVFVIVLAGGPLKHQVMGLLGRPAPTAVVATAPSIEPPGAASVGTTAASQTQTTQGTTGASATAPIYTASDLRDPMKSLLPQPAQAVATQPVDPGITTTSPPLQPMMVPPPTVSIQGLVWGGPQPQVIINKHVYGLDDFIDKTTRIVAIEREGITIAYGGQTQFIPVPSALGPGARDSLSQQAQWR